MGGLGLREVIHNSLVRIGLLDIVVVEVNDRITISEHFSLNSVVEDDLLLPVFIEPLYLSIISYRLFNDLDI